jgi:flagellar biosynthesis protein FlhA
LHAVLRLLLEERVSIRNLPLILEAIAEARGFPGVEGVADHVRRRLGFQIVADHRRPDGSLPVLQLAPEWERVFDGHQTGGDVVLPPETVARLAANTAARLRALADDGHTPVIVTSSTRRRLVRGILVARSVTATVLSYDELGADARPVLLGAIAT